MDTTHLIIVTYDSPEAAAKVLASLKEMEKQKRIFLEDAVGVVKDENGKLKVMETTDATPKKGAVAGGAVGLVIGVVIGGPIGGALLGGLAGALLGKKIDHGVSNDQIQAVTDSLENSSSAIFVEANPDDTNRSLLKKVLEQENGKLYQLDINPDVHSDIKTSMTGFTARH